MYRQTDLEHIKKNLDYINTEALKKRQEIIEPTIKEFKDVYIAILEFIKKNRKIVYGGYAQNHLIKMKNPNDAFYKDTDRADIEFYSYEPLKDIVELADFLHSKKFKYIEGKGGVHEETYKIFVNFDNYVDISYMPKNVYDNLPTIEDNGIRFSHPHLMLIDAFRVYADPITSYWRLDKSFNRFIKLYRYYPIKEPSNKNFQIKKSDNEIINKVRKNIIHNSKLIVIGKYAYNYYVQKVNEKKIDIDYYELISINYTDDNKYIYTKLQKLFPNNKISFKKYYPFFEFFDKRTDY
jgi:hypothetical protein